MFSTKLRQRPRIEIIPMIDVIFFLLVFFMMFTTFKTTPYGLDITLPRASTVASQEDQNVNVYITKDGEFIYQGRLLDALELRSQIQVTREQTPHLVVIINADRDTPYNYVLRVMDILREVGVHRLAFAADPLRGD